MVKIGYGTMRTEEVFEMLRGVGAQRIAPKFDPNYWGHPVQLTQQQLESLRGFYPTHHAHLKGEVRMYVEGGAIEVSPHLWAYDAACGRWKTSLHYFEQKDKDMVQRAESRNLAQRLRAAIAQGSGLAARLS